MIISGAVGPAAYSTAVDAFMFTWPAAVFGTSLLLMGVIALARSDRGHRGAMKARLALDGMVILAAGYGLLCINRSIPAGIGFLVGVLLA